MSRRPLLVLALALLFAPLAPAHAATTAPVFQLGETRPLETSLGDPTLPTAQAVWLDMIRGARTRIELEHFYLSRKPGEALDPVLDEIGRAAARGVKVRLLLDRGFHRTYPQPADSLGTLPGVTLRLIDFARIAGGVQHAKYLAVDGRAAWLGSQNLDWRALSHIHELGARVTVPEVVRAFGEVFERDWAAADSTAKAPTESGATAWPIAFTQDGASGRMWASASPRGALPASVRWDRDVLLERITGARRTLEAQVLSYGVSGHGAKDSTLHQALLAAAARGVRVRLIVSDWVIGGRGEADLRALAASPGIEVRISRVPEWSVGYIPFARVEHLKFMVTDDEWLWLGTSNWDPSYWLTSRNLAVTVQHVPSARRVRDIFETSWNAPGILRLTPDAKLVPRVHGETPPPGMPLYGE